METAILIKEITVIDPDTHAPVDVIIYKDQSSGAMFGIDASFIVNDIGEISENDNPIIPSPFNEGMKLELFED